MLELLAFDKKSTFETSAFFMRINRGSLYTHAFRARVVDLQLYNCTSTDVQLYLAERYLSREAPNYTAVDLQLCTQGSIIV